MERTASIGSPSRVMLSIKDSCFIRFCRSWEEKWPCMCAGMVNIRATDAVLGERDLDLIFNGLYRQNSGVWILWD